MKSVFKSGTQKKELRVLFIRLRSLGDTVLMTPLLRTAKRLPGCRVAVALETPFHEVLSRNRNIDRLFVLPAGRHKLLDRIRAVRAFRSFRPDMVIDLHGGSTSAWMAFFSGAAQRVGYAANRNSFLYNVTIPDSREVWQKQELHTVEHQLAPLKFLGFPIEPLAPLEIPLKSSEVNDARSRLQKLGIRKGFTLIQPAAAFETKQWPAACFAELSTELSKVGLQTVFTVGPGQQALLQHIDSLGAGGAHFLDPLPLREFMAVASLCDLFIGNDTGATHIAAAMGKKIVVIFGSSDYRVWYPWRVEHRLVRQDLPCVPCPGYCCLLYQEPLCIRSVPVHAVLEAVRTIYGIHEQVQAD